MWLFTTRGFFSVVEHFDHPQMLVVRARAASDLEALAELLEGAEIAETPANDYPFRCVVRREVWESAAGELAREIRYPNFKDEVHFRQGAARAAVYGEVWSVMRNLAGSADRSSRS